MVFVRGGERLRDVPGCFLPGRYGQGKVPDEVKRDMARHVALAARGNRPLTVPEVREG